MSDDATKTSLGRGRILPDGTVLADRYRILRLLGVGGMGMVYLAHDEQLNLDVALKVLRAGGVADDMRLERFRSELVLARQISHRNVVRIHDIGQSGDLYFITMDYVDGQSLKQLLELEGALPADRATTIAIELAEALAEAHRNDVVHRDIKPANVLLTEDRAYLTDFGIARSLHAEGMTQTGEVIGTLDYLSPEQARGQPVDGRADIYALGLLLFEMLTGSRPFTGETAEEVLAQRTLARPRELTAKNSAVPAALRGIIERCLAVDPNERYQTADELAADLRAGGASRRYRKTIKQAAIAAVVALAAWAIWTLLPQLPGSGEDAARAESIAVLPFEVALVEGDPDSLSHGLSELLTEHLAAGGSVPVVSAQRVSSTLRDLGLDPERLGEAEQSLLGDLLDADYLVMGRVQQIDGSFRLEARLRRAVTGDVAHRADFDLSDAGAVFTTMLPLAAELRAQLDVAPGTGEALPAPANAEALAAFSLGVEQLSQGNAVDAVEPLQSAVGIAPDFALAWDRLAQALAALGRDRDALAAAESAVAALGDNSSRTAALVRARRAALAGNPDDAVPVMEALLEASPEDIEVRLLLAETYGDGGRLQEALTQLQQLTATSPDHPQAWYLLGKFAILSGDARRAADDYLVKALVIQNRLGNRQGRADVLNALGIAAAQLGDTGGATEYYRQALELRREIGDDRGVAAVLANLARISLRDGRYDQARDELIEARDQLARIGDRWTVANLENELGYLEEQRGRFDAALGHYRESLRIRDDLGDLRALAESYNNVGYTYYLLGEYDNAAVFLERSLETYRTTGNSEGVMYASQTSGILETARGHYDDALKALLESLQIARDSDMPHVEAVTEGYIGNARFLQGSYAAAKASYDNAINGLDALGDERGVAQFTLHDAELSLAMGMWAAAGQALERAANLMSDDDNAATRAFSHRLEGQLLAASGDPAAAANRFATALELAATSGEQAAILKARLAIAEAGAVAEPVAEIAAIAAASGRLGNGRLMFESALALAIAQQASDGHAEAVQILRDTELDQLGGGTLHRDYELYALLADSLGAQGEAEAAAGAWQRAAEAVSRAMDAQTDAQRDAFAALDVVARIRAATELPE